ncbi:hypothetical protein B0J13DRAFT_162821 [Dactylonectria estremocensis]|uniref:DUF7053 domain-containing protein n=1 Tax=Dactylonectria estremocensis TaxID=1079267 RepID=A0A9P9DJB6_9HYPO|nr:hypothetical protein B0J13DRAFT_162821 [Dactylonectria estremocensis]
MRTQCHIDVVAPIPSNVPPRFALEILQTYIPCLSQIPGVVSFDEILTEPVMIADDPFFGPWDETTCAYHIQAAIHLMPGLTKTYSWPAIFQRASSGMRSRGTAPTGIVTWAEWSVRRSRDGVPLASFEMPYGVLVNKAEQWEIHVDHTLEASTLIMPFVQRYSQRAISVLCHRVAEEIARCYLQILM